MAGDMPATRHKFLRNDEWLDECMGHPSSPESEEWNIKTHWKIILTGHPIAHTRAHP